MNIQSVELVREGLHAIVYVTTDGQRVKIISEVYDNFFSHCVYASGIQSAVDSANGKETGVTASP